MTAMTRRGSRLRRRLDGAIGTPLLALLGAARVRRAPPARIERVGIITCSALGDTVLASAVGRDLHRAIPGCHVIAFIAPATRGIAAIMEGIDEEIVLPVAHPYEALGILRRAGLTVLLDILPWPRMTALLAAVSGAQFTVGFRTPRAGRHYAFDAAVLHSTRRHEVDNHLALLAPLGIAGDARPLARPGFLSADRSGAARTVVLHPWASGFRSTMREWPQEHWVALARWLREDGLNVAITGGPADAGRAAGLAAAIGGCGRVEVLAGRATLEITARTLAGAVAIVSVNTGVMHLAAALDVPVVALHGPTDPSRWGPLGARAVSLGPGRAEGGAYLNLGYEYPADAEPCMQRIAVAQVRMALADLLREPSLPSRNMADALA